MKILGIALILLCAGAIVQTLLAAVDSALRTARSLCELLRYTRQMIERFSMCGEEILRRCDAGLLDSCGYKGELMPKSFAELANICEIADGESARLFSEFCRDFGKSYREEELRRCEHYLSLLSARAEVLKSEAAVKKKIILATIVSGAIMLAILLA
ncbi:MAG: hypothetical protein J6M03_09110 [Clostridia bacterium]|nr:hypothetical protein [Clostridia bacterium]